MSLLSESQLVCWCSEPEATMPKIEYKMDIEWYFDLIYLQPQFVLRAGSAKNTEYPIDRYTRMDIGYIRGLRIDIYFIFLYGIVCMHF